MERIMKQRAVLLMPALLFFLMILLAQHGAEIAAVLRDRVLLCLQMLIPSLYGCTAAALLLRESGAAARIGAHCRLTARLLRLPAAGVTAFAVSQFAGYPVGAMLLAGLAESDAEHRDAYAQAAGCCFGCGPAFAVGLAGAQLFGTAAAGWLLFGAGILSNLLLLILTRRFRTVTQRETALPEIRLTAEMLTDAASGAMRSMAQICGMVLLFGVLTALFGTSRLHLLADVSGNLTGIPPQSIRAVTAALWDVTQIGAVCRCGSGLRFRLLLALTGGLLSFGGICAQMQCISVGRGLVTMRKLLPMRIAAAILTACMVYPAASLLPVPLHAAAAFAPRTAVSGSGSVLPALLIFCTGFPFLIKKD